MFPLSALKMMEGLRRQWLPDRSDADGRFRSPLLFGATMVRGL